MSVEAEYEGAFQKCLEETGKAPDVLVQAATVNGEKDWDRLYEVNLVSQANPFISGRRCMLFLVTLNSYSAAERCSSRHRSRLQVHVPRTKPGLQRDRPQRVRHFRGHVQTATYESAARLHCQQICAHCFDEIIWGEVEKISRSK